MGRSSINWINYISESGCRILYPLIEDKITSFDKWKVKCYCGKEFETYPNHLKQNQTKSCGCLRDKTNYNHKRKYEYVNYKNKHGIEILRPLNYLEDKYKDDWICLCPHHEVPVEFVSKPGSVIQNHTTSCGCKRYEATSKMSKSRLIKLRNIRGLKNTEYLTKESSLIRKMLHVPIRYIIYKIDNFTCKKCHNKTNNINLHHIEIFSNTIFNNIESLKLIYDIKNLITLCKDCHDEAHDYNTHNINKIIQEELKLIVNNRIINEDLLNEYNRIVKEEIEPWLNEYINERNSM